MVNVLLALTTGLTLAQIGVTTAFTAIFFIEVPVFTVSCILINSMLIFYTISSNHRGLALSIQPPS